MNMCDKCIHGDGACEATIQQVLVKNGFIEACTLYELNPSIVFEREMVRAVQVLIHRGRVMKGIVTRYGIAVEVDTEPSIPTGEITAILRQGDDE